MTPSLEGADADKMNLFKQWKDIFTNTSYVYQTICLLTSGVVFGFVLAKAQTSEQARKFRLAAFLLMIGQVFSAAYYFSLDSQDVSSTSGKFWAYGTAQFWQATTFIAIMYFTQSIRSVENQGEFWAKHAIGFSAIAFALAGFWTFYLTFAKFDMEGNQFPNTWMANFTTWFVLTIWISSQQLLSALPNNQFSGLPNAMT